MIPNLINKELKNIFSSELLEKKKIIQDNYCFIELDKDKDKKIIQDLGIQVDELGPYKVIFMWETMSQLEIGGYLVVDNLAMGKPSLGGTRFTPTVTIREVASLARGMTLKNAAALLPFGGGKSGIVAIENMTPKEREIIITHFARMLQRYVDIYNPGPDVGTNDEDMKTFAIYNGLNNVVSKTVDMGGNRIDILGAAAGGVVVAMDEIFSKFYKLRELNQFKKYFKNGNNISLDKCTLIIQGFGAVGSNVAKLLAEGKLLKKNPKPPKLIGVSDKDGYIFKKDGFDIYELLRLKNDNHIVSSVYYETKKRGNFKFCNTPNDLLKESADILIPATPIANYISIDKKYNPCVTVDEAGEWMVIIEAANTLSVEKEKIKERYKLEKILYNKRGVFIATDYLVNSGGVIFAAYEKLLPTPKELELPLEIRGDRKKVQEWLDKHKEKFQELARKRREQAEEKRDNVIRENIGLFINLLVENPDLLPHQAAEKISLQRIVHRDKFVKDIMITDFPITNPEMEVKEVANIFVKENIDFLPVVDEDKHLVGVITDWDITRFVIISEGHKNLKVKEIMTPREKVITAAPTDTIVNTVKSLQDNKLSAMPVIDEQDNVLGIVSSDLLVQRTLLKLLEK